MQHKIQKLKNNGSKCDKIQIFFVSLPQNKSSIMIVTNQATDTKRNATSTRNRIMASTMSVDEYFDELIDKVREDYANL
jgi:stalled ribosome rescue protein Dom34